MKMQKLILRLIINAVALWVAITFVPGITPVGGSLSWVEYLILALIFGLVNALLGRLLKFLTCLLNVVTFGLFTLIINAVLFWLTGLIGSYLRVGFTAEWWSALIGAFVVSLVSAILSLFLKDDLKGKKKEN